MAKKVFNPKLINHLIDEPWSTLTLGIIILCIFPMCRYNNRDVHLYFRPGCGGVAAVSSLPESNKDKLSIRAK